MGGALATLAAYDIREELLKAGRAEVQVVCYSFGAPRTGNHAFARDYNRIVPDTWSIINDQACPFHQAKPICILTCQRLLLPLALSMDKRYLCNIYLFI